MIEPQPAPIPTNEVPIVDLVVEDLWKRKESGMQEYGTPLQASNGRDALVDAYYEALDLAVYLRQELERRAIAKQSNSFSNEIPRRFTSDNEVTRESSPDND